MRFLWMFGSVSCRADIPLVPCLSSVIKSELESRQKQQLQSEPFLVGGHRHYPPVLGWYEPIDQMCVT